MTGLVVSPIGELGDERLAQVRAIYEEAFSPGLRVPFSELARPLDADLTFAVLEGGVPAGLAALRLLTSADWSFLRYYAITSQRRGHGLGSQFWHLLIQALRDEHWPTSVIFEVEDPCDASASEPERVIRQRRISFWRACGARQLPVPGYVLPDYTGSGITEPMLLMAATPATAPPGRGDQLLTLVRAIYSDRYGLAADDPIVIGALASARASVHE